MSTRKAVIISDDRKSLGDLEEILTASGHEPVLINDARIAVNTVVNNKPDVILLDLRMPVKNGFELADEINYALKTKKVPIIAMSPMFKDEFSFLFNLCGISGYLKKPINPLDVISAIERATGESNQSTRVIDEFRL